MFATALGEFAEWIESIGVLLKTAPPGTVAVVVLGAAVVGAVIAWFLGKLRTPRPPYGPTPLPSDCTQCPTGNDLRDEITRLKKELTSENDITNRMLTSEGEVFGIFKSAPPAIHRSPRSLRTKVITIANKKGGVGKTTLTLYLAEYFCAQGKRVLVIDLDNQGSLTAFALRVGRVTIPPNRGDRLRIVNSFLAQKPPENLDALLLNGPLAGIQLVTADSSLLSHETALLLRWLQQGGQPDIRYCLSNVLQSDYVQDSKHGFDIVLIDAPPEFTLGAVNALTASTHLLVPTKLDGLSAETVGGYLSRVRNLMKDLNPGLELAGVVGTMTKDKRLDADLTRSEQQAIEMVRQGLSEWGDDTHIFGRDIQNLETIKNAAGTAGLAGGQKAPQMFGVFGAELAERIKL